MADPSSFYPSLPIRPPSGNGTAVLSSSSIMRRRGSFPPHSDFKTEAEMLELKRQAIAKTGPMIHLARLEHHLREARGRVSWAINAYFRELEGRDVYPACSSDTKNGAPSKREVRAVSAFRNEFEPVPLAFAPAADGKAFKVHMASTAPHVVFPTSAPSHSLTVSQDAVARPAVHAHLTTPSPAVSSSPSSSSIESLPPLPAISPHVMLPFTTAAAPSMSGAMPVIIDRNIPGTTAAPGATLPTELLWRIFSMLPPGVVTCTASVVNRHWRDCSSDDGLWEIWFWRRYRNGVPIGPFLPAAASGTHGGVVPHNVAMGPRRLNHGDARPLVIFSFLPALQPAAANGLPVPLPAPDADTRVAAPAASASSSPPASGRAASPIDPSVAMFQSQAQGDDLRAATRHYFARSTDNDNGDDELISGTIIPDDQWLRLFRQRWDCERMRRCPLRECSGGAHVSGAVVPVIYGFPSAILVEAARNGRVSMGLDHIPVGPWELPIWVDLYRPQLMASEVSSVDVLRTPDSCFEGLPGYPFAANYINVPLQPGHVQHLRMHYIQEGPADGPIALLLHGEPSWSYLYRTMIPPLVAAGMRVYAPDLIGFGKSDKPTRKEDYTYQRHVDWIRSFIHQLKLRHIIVFVQDWGGLIGLRLVGEEPDRFAAVLAANTFLPTGEHAPTAAFLKWQSHVKNSTGPLDIVKIIGNSCVRAPSRDILGAYAAPFPSVEYQAGAKQFPLLVPTSTADPASAANISAWQSLVEFKKPFITCFSDSDPITRGSDKYLQKLIPGAAHQRHVIIKAAGHFLQEEKGHELAQLVIDMAYQCNLFPPVVPQVASSIIPSKL